MKKIITAAAVLILLLLSLSASAEESVLVDLDMDTEFDRIAKQQYQKIELVYTRGNVEFESYGEKYFSITRINYYAYKDDAKFFLGYVDQNGVHDKNSELLEEIRVVNTKTRFCVGVSSSSLRNPFSPNLIIQDTEKKSYIDTPPIGFIKIDFETNSLMLYNPIES